MKSLFLKSLIPGFYGHPREFLRVLTLQVYFTYITAINILFILGVISGIAVTFQAELGLAMLGKDQQLGQFLVYILFREMAPLLCSLIIIARSVTAVTAELATMKVQQEIEALEISGINITAYLLAPRIWGGMISLFCMAVTFWFFALIGSWLGANWSKTTPLEDLVTNVASAFMPSDILFFIMKSTIIGSVVFYIACSRGLSLKKAPFEVPIVTNKAVVDSLVVALLLQAILSISFYLFI